MNNGTDFYGISRILLNHAGLPNFFPITVAMQHGWLHAPTTFEASGNPQEIWVWSSKIGHKYREQFPNIFIREVGAPFCYLAERLKIPYPPSEHTGSIVIPMHSSRYVHASFSAIEYAQMLSELPPKFQPITVMLYYLDMNKETIDAYKSKGFNVTSNGSIFDQNFLVNFYLNTYKNKYCIFNELGSGALYAGYLGLKLIPYGPHAELINKGEKHISKKHLLKNRADYLINNLSSINIHEELGTEHFKTKNELKNLILSNCTIASIAKLFTSRSKSAIIKKLLAIKKNTANYK